ncbi:MAG: ABC transporter ATP-binding protein [Anaerolineae bacterium]|nr:ABC transporter ATP-binding protein [Gloeobacterales cyanobacterium ES-bin-313]
MSNFRKILGFFRPYWTQSILSISAVSLFEVIDLAIPYFTGQILNVLSKQPMDGPCLRFAAFVGGRLGKPVDAGLSLAVLLGIIFVVSVMRAPIQPWIGHWFHWDITFRARRDSFQHALAKLLRLPLEYYDENNPGRIAGLVARGISNHAWTYPEIAGQWIPKCVRVVGIFVVILCIDWRIACAFLASFFVILALTFSKLEKLITLEERLDHYTEQTESRTSEIITNIKTVKSFATEAEELKRQEQRFKREFLFLDYRIHLGYVQLNTLRATLVQLCVFLVLAFTLAATLRGEISIGHFITTLTVASMAYSEVSPIGDLAEVFARRYASMVRFHEFMATPESAEALDLAHAKKADRSRYLFTGKLELNNLSFGYDSNRPVLRNLNLLIEPCQTIALVGRSGSGKSTLVKLLFRYFEPTTGAILIDGTNIQDLDITSYRKRLAIVHQEVDVFNGTILDNLTYGNPMATPEQVREACRIARVDEFVNTMPKGYYTIVGERGMRLSGGQRQRLGIARALVADPDILVFDEATSSLDYESERAIQLAMEGIFGTRTVIIIAHRLSTVREADQIVVLDQGEIAEVGNHRELLACPGLYQRLHNLQEGEETTAMLPADPIQSPGV